MTLELATLGEQQTGVLAKSRQRQIALPTSIKMALAILLLSLFLGMEPGLRGALRQIQQTSRPHPVVSWPSRPRSNCSLVSQTAVLRAIGPLSGCLALHSVGS